MGNYSIESFIQDSHSICREERQYALFLYNILCRYGSAKMRKSLKNEKKTKIEHIFQVCRLKNAEKIGQVFYEASFTRDFFYRSKTANNGNFNDALIHYIYKEIMGCDGPIKYVGKVNNLGHNQLEREDLSPKIQDGQFEKLRFKAKCMMNVKPDIAVLYEENGRRYFLFLECKFETKEKPYKDKKTAMKLSQREVQWMVADFLCKYCFEGEIALSSHMVEKKSCLVQFVRNGGEKNGIEIETLIKLNHAILYK